MSVPTHLVEKAVARADKYRKCFWWNASGTSASQRRSVEFDDTFEFEDRGHKYKVSQRLRVSCRNYYFSSEVERDGKKSNITSLKNLLKRLEK